LVNLKDTASDYFIGSLIIVKIQQAIFGRRYIPETKRESYYLYVDEARDLMAFAAKEFDKILIRARKYKLGLIFANQIYDDLPKEIVKKLPTVYTRIKFVDQFYAYKYEGLDEKVGSPLKTPKFLGPSPASYAQYIRKRSVPKPPSKTVKGVFKLANEEETGHEGRTLLSDPGKERRTKTPRNE